ncbi:DUF983 domain-containing protein [Marixanthomonas spongiae]|uniref:DUF983 domain-containing protein n=1 Tax=Marixanthomonas spongiae TaxID=2174845 RepID=A0A2U0I7T5_9FLAO|nr:DUF983 domain-containing protein [Marixanthomonas spongiae]PVW17172.1 DUF983 domain-containing protein [Marixanthomonas spongiae]
MIMKGTKLYSILTGTCPVCHTGSMYKNKNPYVLTKALDMYEHCPHCGTKFKIEPSFFYGAMYVSYAVGVAFAVAAFIIAYFFIGLGRLNTFFAITGTLIVFFPIILRLSRNIWINFFLKYDPDKAD